MIRQTVSGPFTTQRLGRGLWQLTKGAPAISEIYVRTVDPGAAALFNGHGIRSLDLQWRTDCVVIAITGVSGVGYLEATTVIVHEIRDRLYESLPLAGFDAGAKRFWGRIFALMRLPGGRYLLRAITRRSR